MEMELGTKTKGTCCLSGKYGSGTIRTANIEEEEEEEERKERKGGKMPCRFVSLNKL